MRLKEDSTSYKAIGLKTKLKPIPEVPIRHARKDTKRWCKGKLGREHQWNITKIQRFLVIFGSSEERFRQDWVCENCGKQDYDVVRKDGK